MSPEKTQELIAIYPKIFSNQSPNAPFSVFGFECDDGWFNLLKDLIEHIKIICERDGVDLTVAQVKEKFGGLRFYTNGTTDAIRDAIATAEHRSQITCENCGEPASTTERRGWIYTLCAQCIK